MTSKQVSICIGADLVELLGGVSDGDAVSARVNRTTDRYLTILSECKPPLSADDLQLLRENLPAAPLEAGQIRGLSAIVADSPIGRTQSGLRMIETLKGCTYAELVAILELIGA